PTSYSDHPSTPPQHHLSSPTRRSSDLVRYGLAAGCDRLLSRADALAEVHQFQLERVVVPGELLAPWRAIRLHAVHGDVGGQAARERKSTRLNCSHVKSSYAVFCLKNQN